MCVLLTCVMQIFGSRGAQMNTTMAWVFVGTVSGHEKGKNVKKLQGFNFYGSGWNENGRESTAENPLDVTNGGIANSEPNKISVQVLPQSLAWRLDTHRETVKTKRQKKKSKFYTLVPHLPFLSKFVHYLFYDFHKIVTIAP